jgi:hypothetical protein
VLHGRTFNGKIGKNVNGSSDMVLITRPSSQIECHILRELDIAEGRCEFHTREVL